MFLLSAALGRCTGTHDRQSLLSLLGNLLRFVSGEYLISFIIIIILNPTQRSRKRRSRIRFTCLDRCSTAGNRRLAHRCTEQRSTTTINHRPYLNTLCYLHPCEIFVLCLVYLFAFSFNYLTPLYSSKDLSLVQFPSCTRRCIAAHLRHSHSTLLFARLVSSLHQAAHPSHRVVHRFPLALAHHDRLAPSDLRAAFYTARARTCLSSHPCCRCRLPL